MNTLDFGWNFENTYAQLPDKMYRKVLPTPVSFPEIALFNSSLAKELGLNDEALDTEVGAKIFTGNIIPE